MSGQPAGGLANRSAAMDSDTSSVTKHAPGGICAASAWAPLLRSGYISLTWITVTSTISTAKTCIATFDQRRWPARAPAAPPRESAIHGAGKSA